MCRIHKALPHSGSFSAPPCKKHGFGKEALDLLSIEEKLSIARIVRKKYGASAKQISRITGLDPQLLKELL